MDTTSTNQSNFSASDLYVRFYTFLVFKVYFITETLSLFNKVSSTGITILWLISTPLLLFLFRRSISTIASSFIQSIRGRNIQFKAAKIVTITIFILTFASGFFGTPNTCDGLIYHIPRFLHWLEYSSVNFFPTHCERMIVHPPLYEYCLMHVYCLFGSDRLLFLVQWFAFINCAAVSYALVGLLGGTKNAKFLALFLVATLPIVITQSSAIKNDLFFASSTLSFVYFLIKASIYNKNRDYLTAAVAMSCSIATKGLSFLFIPVLALPISAYYLFSKDFINNWRNRFIKLSVIAAFGSFMSSPHLIRTWQSYGSISSSGSDSLVNQDYSLKAQPANVARMLASNIGAPVEPYRKTIEHILESIFGREIHNPKNIYLGSVLGTKFTADAAPTETKMSNPVHILLFLMSVIYYVFIRKRLDMRKIIAITSLLLFIVFSIFVQWSPWVTRYHILFLVLSCCLAAMMLNEESFAPRKRMLAMGILFASVIPIAMLCSLVNAYRPIIKFRGFSILSTPRYHQYFMYDNSPRLTQNRRREDYEIILDKLVNLSSPKDQCVSPLSVYFSSDANANTPTYLWTVVAREKYGQPLTLSYHNVENPSKSAPRQNTGNYLGKTQFFIARNSTSPDSDLVRSFSGRNYTIFAKTDEFVLLGKSM